MHTPQPHTKVLHSFALAMIAVVAIIDLRGTPLMASYGLSSIFLYAIAAICFLIPSAVICSQLTTSFPEEGGLYAWIRHAFGDKTGFFAIWLEWINNVVSFPASVTFIVVTLTYVFNPQLAQNKIFVLFSTLIVLWLTTLFTCLGIKASSRLNIYGALLGTIIPAIIIINLSVCWLMLQHPVQIHFTWQEFLPNLHSNNLAFFSSTLLGYAGMQVIGFHATNVWRPQTAYPRAILIAVIIILFVTVFSSIAVAIVVPVPQLNVVSGLMQSFSYFFNAFHIPWATSILALLIALSAVATLNTWFLGPARGLAKAAENGFLPPRFSYKTKNEAPVPILIVQGVIASMMIMVFLYMADISGGFWVLLDLSAQSTLLMYILLFAAGIKLKQKTNSNIFKRNINTEICGCLGILSCLFALGVSFLPPKTIHTGSLWHYESILIISNIIFLSIPFLILKSKKKFLYQQSNK